MATCRESGPEWDNEIKDDVTAECTKFGVVEHAFVDINSKVRGNRFTGRWSSCAIQGRFGSRRAGAA